VRVVVRELYRATGEDFFVGFEVSVGCDIETNRDFVGFSENNETENFEES
jgi:hypothetical protein